MKIPTWRECADAVVDGRPTAIQRFVYGNEPAGGGTCEQEFRDGLQAVVDATLEDAAALVDVWLAPIGNKPAERMKAALADAIRSRKATQ